MGASGAESRAARRWPERRTACHTPAPARAKRPHGEGARQGRRSGRCPPARRRSSPDRDARIRRDGRPSSTRGDAGVAQQPEPSLDERSPSGDLEHSLGAPAHPPAGAADEDRPRSRGRPRLGLAMALSHVAPAHEVDERAGFQGPRPAGTRARPSEPARLVAAPEAWLSCTRTRSAPRRPRAPRARTRGDRESACAGTPGGRAAAWRGVSRLPGALVATEPRTSQT